MKQIINFTLPALLILMLFISCSNEKREYEAVLRELSLARAKEFIRKYPDSDYTAQLMSELLIIYKSNPSGEILNELLNIFPPDSEEYHELIKLREKENNR